MNYCNNVALFEKYGIDISKCANKLKTTLSLADPELVERNLELASISFEKLNRKSNYSLVSCVCNDFFEDKVKFLQERDVDLSASNVFQAHLIGYEKPEALEDIKGVVKAA